MKSFRLKYQAKALRQDKMIIINKAILFYVAAIITSAMLPSILVQYVVKSEDMFAAPPAYVQYIPVVAFALASLYFVYALVVLFTKANEIKKLDAEILGTGEDCCCMPSDKELDDLESMANEVISKAKKKTASRSKRSKKSK